MYVNSWPIRFCFKLKNETPDNNESKQKTPGNNITTNPSNDKQKTPGNNTTMDVTELQLRTRLYDLFCQVIPDTEKYLKVITLQCKTETLTSLINHIELIVAQPRSSSSFQEFYKLLLKLILCITELLDSMDTTQIGIASAVYFQSSKMQNCLNVKRLEKSENVSNQRYLCKFNPTYLSCDKILIMRLIVSNASQTLNEIISLFQKHMKFLNYFIFSENIIEVYYSHIQLKSKNIKNLKNLLEEIDETPFIWKLAFTTDIRILKEIAPRSLVFSQILAYLYCNLTQRLYLDGIDKKAMAHCTLHAVNFLFTNNLTTFNKLHASPLIAVSAGKPKFLLNKHPTQSYETQYLRDSRTIGEGSRFGTITYDELKFIKDINF